MAQHILVIGAGQAATSVIETLRREGYAGRITLVGEEAVPPYQRPPLSKKYLLGELPLDRLLLKAPQFWADQGVETRFGVRATAIDAANRQVSLSDGSMIGYDLLALTTGSRARALPEAVGGQLRGVHTMRHLADADGFAPALQPGRRLLIVGGGYIGLEAAAVASQRGLDVTLIEMAPRILSRVASAETADFFMRLHAAHGVRILTQTGLTRLIGTDGHVSGAVLSDGQVLAVDFVLAGVGILPNAELAASAGCILDNGVMVDAQCRTTQPHIYAAGDLACFPWRGRRIRLESVQNAIDQGAACARAMLGHDVTYDPVPWFWSDQYAVKLQIAGLAQGYDRVVTRPGKDDWSGSVWCYRGAQLLAVDAMNDPRAYMQGKRWIEAGFSPDPDRLADPRTELKSLG